MTQKTKKTSILTDIFIVIMAAVYFLDRGNWEYQWVIDVTWMLVLILVVARKFFVKK